MFFNTHDNVRDLIPVKRIYNDGIFYLGNECWSASFLFSDVSYILAGEDERKDLFLSYCDILNSLESDVLSKITLIKKRSADPKEGKLDLKGDGYDDLRNEYNGIIDGMRGENNENEINRYLTLTVKKKDISGARIYFERQFQLLSSQFEKLGSKLKKLDLKERLEVISSSFGNELPYFDLSEEMKRGSGVTDIVCPETFVNERDHFVSENRFGRAIYMKTYPAYLSDDFINGLLELDPEMTISLDILPVPTEQAVSDAEKRLLGLETNIVNWQRKQVGRSNVGTLLPYDLDIQRKEMKEFLNDLKTRDQRMFFGTLSIVYHSKDKSGIDSGYDLLTKYAKSRNCSFSILRYQQIEGLQTTIPFGVRNIFPSRTLTTESLAAFIPFCVSQIRDPNGVCYGKNALSGSLLTIDRHSLLNGNSFILGVSGGGKSFMAKNEMIPIALKGESDIMIIDPENEYCSLTDALGGQTIRMSASSKDHINAMDLAGGPSKENIALKSEFILSLYEQLCPDTKPGAMEKSIIDRCCKKVYMNGNGKHVPTLENLRKCLLIQPEKEAKRIATSLELFTAGSLDTFSKQTNVDTDASMITYDISGLGKELMGIGMLILLDSIFNRIVLNRNKGRPTYIYIDEIYLLFKHDYSAEFLFGLWKRVRKYGACCTGITQNVGDLLQSHTARTMLSNSELLILLNQASSDREELVRLLGISENAKRYITDSPAGSGLIRCGGCMVPFSSDFPKEGKLYDLMNTSLK